MYSEDLNYTTNKKENHYVLLRNTIFIFIKILMILILTLFFLIFKYYIIIIKKLYLNIKNFSKIKILNKTHSITWNNYNNEFNITINPYYESEKSNYEYFLTLKDAPKNLNDGPVIPIIGDRPVEDKKDQVAPKVVEVEAPH